MTESEESQQTVDDVHERLRVRQEQVNAELLKEDIQRQRAEQEKLIRREE